MYPTGTKILEMDPVEVDSIIKDLRFERYENLISVIRQNGILKPPSDHDLVVFNDYTKLMDIYNALIFLKDCGVIYKDECIDKWIVN